MQYCNPIQERRRNWKLNIPPFSTELVIGRVAVRITLRRLSLCSALLIVTMELNPLPHVSFAGYL